MSVQSMIGAGRVLAARLMLDTGTITRGSGGGGTLDPTTGVWTPATATVVHTGPCRVKMPGAQEQEILFGDSESTATRFVIVFPADIPRVLIDDMVVVVSVNDPLMVNRRFRVTAIDSRTLHMARHLGAEVVE